MLHHIAVVTPRNRKRYAEIYHRLRLPKVYLPSAQAINACYAEWGLERMSHKQAARAESFPRKTRNPRH